ncbi:hypothetical protein XENOCAPTIV_011804 [Xenoophorus captivus]|uniref:Uncharacterized protein n=1 Tax=Xenoophorus captivus TaxID=1517983 RepID=A0ABV0S8E7_9TELE
MNRKTGQPKRCSRFGVGSTLLVEPSLMTDEVLKVLFVFLQAFLLAVGGCATVSSFSVVGFLVLLYKWKTRTIANGKPHFQLHLMFIFKCNQQTKEFWNNPHFLPYLSPRFR